MRADNSALTAFARLGLKLFWFRQFMFLGATAITSAYLSNYIPVLCYLLCLSAELAEAYLARRVLKIKNLSPKQIDGFVNAGALVGAWSSLSICIYGISVSQLGEAQFLFVPLIYMFAAALYGAMFNHQVKAVLLVRMAVYFAGFLILGILGIISAEPEDLFLACVQLFTVISASVFFLMNAWEFRRHYCERREREHESILREAQLRREMDERRNAEAARESSETRFRSLFENAPIPIREEDLSGMKRLIDDLGIEDPVEFSAYLDQHPEFLEACSKEIVVVDANRASLQQHGYTDRSEMLAKVVKALSPAAMQIVRLTVSAIHNGATGKSYETKITRLDGQVRTVAATWSVVPGHEETYARILLCSVDLTDWLASEAALRQAQKMEAVGQLTGGVAHDFNNLLTVINGNVDLLEETIEVDPEFSDPIRKAVQRGAELTQRLLAFSRKQPLSARSVDLRELIAGMTSLLQRSLGEEITIDFHIPDHVWPVYADPGQVEAALLNLALNSRDAMPKGGTLSISCGNRHMGPENDCDVEPGDFVALSVTDTGIGMQPNVVRRAFEPFFTTKDVGKGSGLGLSMIYGFAKQSHGSVKIESEPDRGTSVSLFLPRATAPNTDMAASDTSEFVQKGEGEIILVLEDDEDVRTYLVRLMTSLGYRPLPARDALQARRILDEVEKIDLLVSDIMLPGGLRGPEFAAEMLACFPDTPVIFISGRPAEIERAQSRNIRQASVLSKPFTRQEISERILQALGRRI